MRAASNAILLWGMLAFTQGGAAQQPARIRPLPGQRLGKLFVADVVQVRTRKPPLAFDNKGKPRRLSEQELKELRGDNPRLPGYASDFKDLKTGQMVTVYLARGEEVKDAGKGKGTKSGLEENFEWAPAGVLRGQVMKVDGPEFAKPARGTSRKTSRKPQNIPRHLTISYDPFQSGKVPVLRPGEKLEDLTIVAILVVDQRIAQ